MPIVLKGSIKQEKRMANRSGYLFVLHFCPKSFENIDAAGLLTFLFPAAFPPDAGSGWRLARKLPEGWDHSSGDCPGITPDSPLRIVLKQDRSTVSTGSKVNTSYSAVQLIFQHWRYFGMWRWMITGLLPLSGDGACSAFYLLYR